jgi:hypothetical protein
VDGSTTSGSGGATTTGTITSAGGATTSAGPTSTAGGGTTSTGGTGGSQNLPTIGCTTELSTASTHTETVVSDMVIDYTLDDPPARDHYRVAILMFDAQSVPPEDPSGWSYTEYTPSQLGEAYFKDPDGVAHFMAEASYGNVSLEGTVVGWIDVGAYDGASEVFRTSVEDYAALALDYVDFNDYDITYIVAITDNYDDLEQVGWGLGNSLQGVYPMGIDYMVNSWFWNEAGTRAHSSTALPSTSWSHELSHTLGAVGHSISLNCGTNVVSNDCTIEAYGNPFSIMGAYVYGTHHTIMEKLAMNFLEPTQVQTVTESGSYGICPIETADGQVKGLSIPLPEPLTQTTSEAVFDRLLIEYRTPTGFDRYIDRLAGDFVTEFLPDGPIDSDGITILLGYATETDSTVLLDAHPETAYSTSGIKISGDAGKYADARIRVGETLVLDALGVSITYAGKSGDGGAFVQVDYL